MAFWLGFKCQAEPTNEGGDSTQDVDFEEVK